MPCTAKSVPEEAGMFAALPALTAAVGHSISIAERAALEVPSNVLRIVWREAATQFGVELSGLG